MEDDDADMDATVADSARDGECMGQETEAAVVAGESRGTRQASPHVSDEVPQQGLTTLGAPLPSSRQMALQMIQGRIRSAELWLSCDRVCCTRRDSVQRYSYVYLSQSLWHYNTPPHPLL